MIRIEYENSGCFSGCTGIIALAGWFTAVIRDVMFSKWLWVIFDVLIPPLGAFRGIFMWLGWA
ncbi:hypothetical protein [Woodsholea maritima]|uniref:hypothetical protein n=1 Tax=Woodsholea maritima TaxID=240237 RepID=UPI000376BF60|nr:hypothetical protein [Woodsholea maritima]